jgi:ABC-2 type transport system permease protein
MKIRNINALVKVEMKKLYRDPMSLGIIILMPVGLALIIYLAFRDLYPPDIAPLSQFELMLPGTMGYGIIYLGMMVALALCEYREAGLLKRLESTPTSTTEYMGIQNNANVYIGILQVLILYLLIYILGYRPGGGLLGFMLLIIFFGIFSVTAVGLGFITATIAKNAGVAGGLSTIFIVPMMVFGTKLAVFNESTRTIAKFTPNYYVTDALRLVFNGTSLSDQVIWQNLLILSIISLVIVVAGIQLFKKNEFR